MTTSSTSFRHAARRIAIPVAISISVFGGLALLILAAAGTHFAVRIIVSHQEVRSWPTVTGELLAVKFQSCSDPCVKYKYAVGGRQYVGTSFSVTKCTTSDGWTQREVEGLEPSVGKQGGVTVYFDRHDPTRSCLYRSNEPAWITMPAILLAAIAGSLFLLRAYFVVKEARREQLDPVPHA